MNIRSIFNSQFYRNTFVLFSGNAVNQIILLLTYPIISRLYEPADFGHFEQVNAIFLFIVLLASLRYEYAIIIAKDDNEASNVLTLSLFLLIVFSVVVFILLLLFRSSIAVMLSNPKLELYLFWISPFLLVAGMQQILYNWIIRKKNFKLANSSNILKSSTNSLGRVALGFIIANPISLFLSRGISFLLSLLILVRKEIIPFFNALKNGVISLPGVMSVAKKYKDFPLYMGGGVILNRFTTSLTPLLLSGFFGLKVLGFYAMANTALNIPISILRNSIQTVFLQEASELKNKEKKISGELLKITLLLFTIGIIPTGLIIGFGPKIFSFILGSQWELSGTIASIIIIWLFFTIVATPSMAIVPVVNLQQYYLILQTILCITRIVVLFGTYTLYGELKSVLYGLMLHGSLFNIFNVIYVMKKTHQIEIRNFEA
ncbi:MAG: oligosaccharide flippase family protein [Candidatus Marinimicrobia bacterium]|nr:oligosaccharide flippase family protein [Candidatus Neomarinimicrobiota bacterium]